MSCVVLCHYKLRFASASGVSQLSNYCKSDDFAVFRRSDTDVMFY